MLVDPGIQFKSVEADTLDAYGKFGEVRTDLGIEAVADGADRARQENGSDPPIRIGK